MLTWMTLLVAAVLWVEMDAVSVERGGRVAEESCAGRVVVEAKVRVLFFHCDECNQQRSEP